MLREMGSRSDRRARFVCALALVTERGEEALRGTVEGTIHTSLRGQNGFGYDPLFLPNAGQGRTMAELDPAEKDTISHRGAALTRLPGMIQRLLG